MGLVKNQDTGKIGEDWFTSELMLFNDEYGTCDDYKKVLEYALDEFANKNGLEINLLNEARHENEENELRPHWHMLILVNGNKENINLARNIIGHKQGFAYGLVEWKEKMG